MRREGHRGGRRARSARRLPTRCSPRDGDGVCLQRAGHRRRLATADARRSVSRTVRLLDGPHRRIAMLLVSLGDEDSRASLAEHVGSQPDS